MSNRDQIGKAEIVPVRVAFPHEALDFTMWLEQNIDALADRIGLELTVLEREKAVGSFIVDLLCEDGNGNQVIIENQLERTDHDHLGKLLTYMVNLDAKTAIWVTPEPRPEHERVIDWLNESTGADMAFYLVKVEAIRIEGSPFAPFFTVLAAPDEQTREIGQTKKQWAERHHKRLDFWTGLLERSRDKTHLFSNVSPGPDYWLSTGAGRSGLALSYLILRDGAGIDLNIDVGEQDRNKAVFDTLHADKDAIEAEFGAALDWRRLDDKRSSRVVWITREHGNLNTPERWPELQDVLIKRMTRFDEVFRPRLKALDI